MKDTNHELKRRAQRREANIKFLIFVLAVLVIGVLMGYTAAKAVEAIKAPPSIEQPTVQTAREEAPPEPQEEPEPVVVIRALAGAETPQTPEEPVYMGEFVISHYCACVRCCGKSEDDPWYGVTATGTRATEGRTVAVDPDVIPYGSEVIVYYEDGSIASYIAEDCGGAIRGNRLDLYMEDHGKAWEAGLKAGSVYILPKEPAK